MSNPMVSAHFQMSHRIRRVFSKAFFFAFLYCFAAFQSLLAQSTKHPFDNPRFEKLRATLLQPCTVVTQSVTFRNAAKGIQSAFPVTIWVDRRLDAEQIVSIPIESRNLGEYVDALAKATGSKTSHFDNIIYFAPSNQSPQVDALYWDLATRNNGEFSKKMLPELNWSSPQPASKIIHKCLSNLPARLNNPEQIPWDIWAENSIEPASTAAQLTCLLAGFELSIQQADKKALKIVQTSAPKRIVYNYTVPANDPNEKAYEEWMKQWPDCVATFQKRLIQIEGSVATHREFFSQFIAKKLVIPGKNAINRASKLKNLDQAKFSFKTENELKEILKALEQQLDIQFTPKPLDPIVGERRVKLELKDATLDELLRAVGKEAKVDFKRKDDVVEMYINPL